jgi:hypothetical protein
MRHRLVAVAILLAAAASAAAAEAGAPGLVLVRDGQPACVIVTAASPSRPAATAAAELQTYLKKASGAQVPVKKEDALSADERAGTLIAVGTAQLAAEAGVRADAFPPEGFVIRTVGRRVFLAGCDDVIRGKDRQNGTYFAAVAFLEDALGVRWLWPGPLGEVVPEARTLTVLPLDRTDAPKLRQRKVRDWLGQTNSDKWLAARKAMPMDDKPLAEMAAQSGAWMRHMRLGSSVEHQYGHGFATWWEQYHEAHPDWFAQQSGGSREWPKSLGGYDRVKICVSNPAVLDQWVANAVAYFKVHPEGASFSASPNDNAYSGHCMCERCKAWDPPDAPKVELTSVNANGEKVAFEYPALTDRYVRFYNLAAERLAKEAPGKLVGGYAYGAWKTPPVREKLRENVMIGFVGYGYLTDEARTAGRQSWDGWAKAASHLFLRPNLLHDGCGYPVIYARRLGEDLRHCGETGMMAADFDSLTHHWAGQGLNYYVLSRLLWNPSADVEAIIDDYCRKGFGPAAPAVRAYFDGLERQTTALAAAVEPGTRGWSKEVPEAMLKAFAPQALAPLRVHLDKARQQAAGDARVLERIEFLAKGLEYARLQSAALAAVEAATQGGDWAPARAAVEAREKLLRENLYGVALGVPNIAYLEASRKTTFFGRPPSKARAAATSQ